MEVHSTVFRVFAAAAVCRKKIFENDFFTSNADKITVNILFVIFYLIFRVFTHSSKWLMNKNLKDFRFNRFLLR
jgi:hypothetical protein